MSTKLNSTTIRQGSQLYLCNNCKGEGRTLSNNYPNATTRCPVCHGNGYLEPQRRRGGVGQIVDSMPLVRK